MFIQLERCELHNLGRERCWKVNSFVLNVAADCFSWSKATRRFESGAGVKPSLVLAPLVPVAPADTIHPSKTETKQVSHFHSHVFSWARPVKPWPWCWCWVAANISWKDGRLQPPKSSKKTKKLMVAKHASIQPSVSKQIQPKLQFSPFTSASLVLSRRLLPLRLPPLLSEIDLCHSPQPDVLLPH